MTENNVVVLPRKEKIDDPLTEILRTGEKRLIAQAVEAEFGSSYPPMRTRPCRTVANGSFGTGTIRPV
jgi:hypothetical protein